MTMTIDGMGGSFIPRRGPEERKRRRRPEEPHSGAAASAQAAETTVHDSWFSEQSRAEIAAVAQAIQMAETATEIVEMASGGLSQISTWLAAMRGEIEQAVALHSGEESPASHAAHQRAMEQARDEIAGLVNSLQFGRLRLLDGGLGCTGMAFGDGLDFVRGSPRARASSPEGYPVWIRREATRASALVSMDMAPFDPVPGGRRDPPRLVIEENSLRAEFAPAPRQNLGEIAAGLQQAVQAAGLAVVVEEGPCGQLLLRHIKHGAAHGITLACSIPGVFSQPDGGPLRIGNGQDVAGSINGEPARGEGQILTGMAGNRTTDGLAVRFSGNLPVSAESGLVADSLERLGMGLEPDEMTGWHLMGRVILVQQPFVLRFGAAGSQTVSIRLDSMHPRGLGLGVDNASNFRSLAELRLGDGLMAASALKVIVRAEEELSQAQARLEELRGGALKESLCRLREDAERQRQIYTNIADGQGASQVAHELRNYMEEKGPAALNAQMQPLPGAMLRLLTDESARAPRLWRDC